MLQLFSSVTVDPTDLIAIGFVVFLMAGLLLAFFLYFRTAFKGGGWKNVKRSAWIALGALAICFIERVIQNHEIGSLKRFVGSAHHRELPRELAYQSGS